MNENQMNPALDAPRIISAPASGQGGPSARPLQPAVPTVAPQAAAQGSLCKAKTLPSAESAKMPPAGGILPFFMGRFYAFLCRMPFRPQSVVVY